MIEFILRVNGIAILSFLCDYGILVCTAVHGPVRNDTIFSLAAWLQAIQVTSWARNSDLCV